MNDKIRAFDPGWIRLEQVIKAGLAMVTAMAVMLAVMVLLAPARDIAPVIFSFIVTFVSFMAANEVQPNARKRTILLSAPFFMVAPFVAGAVQPYLLLGIILLLAVMFVSFYVRRYGMRAAELGLVAVLAYYFSALFGATLATAVWFAIGAVVGVASALLWQFVLRPYNPDRFLQQGVAAFKAAALAVVDGVTGELAAPGQAGTTKAALRRVRSARQATEMQLPGVTGAPQLAAVPRQQLRLALFNAEQALQDLAAFTATITQQGSDLPAILRSASNDTLYALKAALAHPNLADQAAALSLARQRQDERVTADDVGESVKLALAGLGSAAERAAQAIGGVETLLSPPHSAPAARSEITKPGPLPAQPAAGAPHPYGLHPTTVLGIQAVVACALAMIVSALLELDRPYWAFWTAFIVVAGPAGESLRKLLLRVLGITLGAMFGTLLVVLLPDNLAILVPLQILALMLVLYTRVVNYAWMVFWVTTFVALLYSVSGVPPATLLFERPANTLVGAAIAALVVLFVMPIHEQAKFAKALIGFLQSMDSYLTAIAGGPGEAATPATATVALQLSDAYATVTQTLPALTLEANPLSGGHSTVAQVAAVNNLYTEIEDFARFIAAGAQEIRLEEMVLVASMMATIHENLGALARIAGGQPGLLQQLPRRSPQGRELSWIAMDGASNAVAPAGLSVDIHLFRINQALLQLAETLESLMGEQYPKAVYQ